jgi:sec-independent protein translocase protein TatC
MKNLFHLIWKILSFPFRIIIWILRYIFSILRGILNGVKEFFGEDPEDAPIADTLQKAIEHPMEILVHLDALRKHLTRAVIFLLIMCVIGFAYASQIMDWLASSIGGIQELQAIEVTEPIGVVMRVTLLTGFTFSLPYICLELLLFAAPGLTRRARFLGLFAIPLALLFFVGGMAFAYFFLIPAALPVLLNFMGIPTLPRPSSYISFVTNVMFWIGICFEFPLVTYVLSAMGIIRAQLLQKHWRLAVVILSILAAAVTPTIDPLNMLLVLIPLVLLYFLGIVMAHIAQIRRAARKSVS